MIHRTKAMPTRIHTPPYLNYGERERKKESTPSWLLQSTPSDKCNVRYISNTDVTYKTVWIKYGKDAWPRQCYTGFHLCVSAFLLLWIYRVPLQIVPCCRISGVSVILSISFPKSCLLLIQQMLLKYTVLWWFTAAWQKLGVYIAHRAAEDAAV